MAITYIGQAAVAGDTLALPAHQPGDLIVMLAYNAVSAIVPSDPGEGFTSIAALALAGNTQGHRVAWKFAATASEAVGTWTNATLLSAVIYRGVAAAPIGAIATLNTTIDITFPAVAGQGDARSVFLAMFGRRSGSNASVDVIEQSVTAPPAGLVNRLLHVSGLITSGIFEQSGVVGFTEKVIQSTASTRFRSSVIELLAAAEAPAPIEGRTAATLGTLGSVSGARLAIQGQSPARLSSVVLSASARLTLTASSAIVLGALLVGSVAGSESHAGLSVTLGDLTAQAAGVLEITAVASIGLEPLMAISAASNVHPPALGTIAVTLGELQLASEAESGPAGPVRPRSTIIISGRAFSLGAEQRPSLAIASPRQHIIGVEQI